MLNIRRSRDLVILNMGISIPGQTAFTFRQDPNLLFFRCSWGLVPTCVHGLQSAGRHRQPPLPVLLVSEQHLYHLLSPHPPRLTQCTHRRLRLRDATCLEQGKKVRSYFYHDDVIKWKHFPRYWPFMRGIQRSLVNSPHKRRVALIFFIFAWTNGWANNLDTGDLRRHCAHYNVTVMHIAFTRWHHAMEALSSSLLIGRFRS